MSPSATPTPYAPSTLAIHADDHLSQTTDVAPPIHLSTTYRYPSNPSALAPVPADTDPSAAALLSPTAPLIYSRVAASNLNRLETLLAPLQNFTCAEISAVIQLFPTTSKAVNFHAEGLPAHIGNA